MRGPVIPPGDPQQSLTQGTFVVRLARRALMGEVALHGESTIPLRPGQILLDLDDGTRLAVKGIEFVKYSDKVGVPVNPWLIVETARFPEDFPGRSFLIREGDVSGLE